MIIEEINGNILNTDKRVIAHGVNCQNVMGSGVAKALYSKYPLVKKGYHILCDSLLKDVTNRELLGIVGPVEVNEIKVILNCFTQEHYGRDGRLYCDYDAIRECFERICYICEEMDIFEIAIPKIGCGLAGGDWGIVRDIINETTGDCVDVYVYSI